MELDFENKMVWRGIWITEDSDKDDLTVLELRIKIPCTVSLFGNK